MFCSNYPVSVSGILLFIKFLQLVASREIDFTCGPNPPSPLATQFAPLFGKCLEDTKKFMFQYNPDSKLNTGQLLEKYGYPYKEYNVTTSDGYILSLYRILSSPNDDLHETVWPKQSVLVHHGLGAASDSWFFLSGNRNLPFKLADAGYDVWLGNSRGTTYSRGHVKFNSDTDLRYWDFSYHELGIYDMPALVDKIIEESKNEKILFIGHSMANTMYFVGLSEIPNLNDKILAGFMMAPVAHIGHANIVLRLLIPVLTPHYRFQPANWLLNGRFGPSGTLLSRFNISVGAFCDWSAAKCGICDNIFYSIAGYDATQMNNSQLSHILTKLPNTFSARTFAHYLQQSLDCKFRKYDFGLLENQRLYGSPIPPEYKLEKISAPTYFYYGELDSIAQPNDVMITASKMNPNALKVVHKVDWKYWNHPDFITGKDADKLVYDFILKEMKKYSSNVSQHQQNIHNSWPEYDNYFYFSNKK